MKNSSILSNIRKSFQRKDRLIPFVGAGFSRNIASYPTWNTFVNDLKNDLRYEPSIKFGTTEAQAFDQLPNALEKTEYYVRSFGKVRSNIFDPTSSDDYEQIYENGRKQLIRKIRNTFDPNRNPFDPVQWSVHLLLLEKFPKLIYTTNWDDTLERPEIHQNFNKLNPRENYAFSKQGNNDGKPRVIKYHGDFKREEFIVACLTDYQARMSQTHCLDIKLKSDILRYDLLLLGYSFSDPNIQLMIHQLSEVVTATNSAVGGRHIDTKIYLVTLEKPEDLRVNLLRDTFLSLEPYHLLDPTSDYDSNGYPIGSVAKRKMEDFLRNL
ncbi:MAG: SIR2 family protein [Candidatus Thiodiazotropha taylori]